MLKLGENGISKLFLGETRILKAYLGNTLVYSEGDAPSILPEGYTRLEYIENPLGNSAYFNTNVVTSTTINFQVDFMSYDDIGASGYGVIIGGMYDHAVKRYHLADSSRAQAPSTMVLRRKDGSSSWPESPASA